MNDCFSIERLNNPFFNIQDYLRCDLPATTEQEAIEFLSAISSGTMASSAVFYKMGVNIPVLRSEYETMAKELIARTEQKLAAGIPRDEVARWAVQQRTKIALAIRQKQGLTSVVSFGLRDIYEYGWGGRTFANLEKRNLLKGLSKSQIVDKLIVTSAEANTVVSRNMYSSAKYLKRGGMIGVVVSLPFTAHAVLTAPEGEIPHVLAKESGNFIGSAAGTSLATGLCLAFGVASGGWGLLACGLVGGATGGFLGDMGGDKLYYIADPNALNNPSNPGVIDSCKILQTMP